MKPLETNRITALDTLRGLSIFGMILSGLLPWTGLPDWMYHCQVPPPKHIFNPNLPGITWVDLVFPFFMFSMGAAIPLALSRRLEKGESLWKIIIHILWRGALMVALAIYIDNSSPWALFNDPPKWIWLRSLVGFSCILMILARWPNYTQWKSYQKYLVRIIGIIGVIALMLTVHKGDGGGFSKDASDIIIRLLAFGYVGGCLVWLFSRNNTMLRIASLGIILALHINSYAGGKVITFLDTYCTKVSWIAGPGWVQVLMMVLPGTIIGDYLLEWSRRPKDTEGSGLSLIKSLPLLVFLLAIVVSSLIYFKIRFVEAGLVTVIGLCILVYLYLKESSTPLMKLLQVFFQWATFYIIIGFLLDPFEGGIKKDEANPSYYFAAVGLAITMLIFFFILMEGLKKDKWVRFLQIVGSNPMLAYMMGSGIVLPLYFMASANKVLEKFVALGLWADTTYSVAMTLTICLFVYLFTRAKIYLRL